MIMHRIGARWARALSLLSLLGVLSLSAASCDFLDPTSVENPRTTDDDLAQALNPSASLLPGLRAQFSRMVQATVVLTENISDNYSIHGTGLNHAYDLPATLTPSTLNSTGSVTGAYWNAQELRALATFLIDVVMPADQRKTETMVAEAHYRRGMAYLYLGENFVAAPIEVDGTPEGPAQLLALAESDLMAAQGEAGDIGLAAKAALARLHRLLGDRAQAASFAGQVVAASPSFVFFAEYDQASLSNAPYAYLVSRTLQEMQPLPRLDFLDPKYLSNEATIPVATAEEMHLILAEAAMAGGQWGNGRAHLATAVDVARARPTVTFDDSDQRLNNSGAPRPRHASIRVAADATSPYRAGLVLNRPGTITAYPVSGTSLSADSIRGLATSNENGLLHALYLARQEMMFLEGRRMSDLGIRLPIMLREIETNPNIAAGDVGTQIFIPPWIPPNDEMDLFTPASPYPAGTQPSDNTQPSTLQVVIMHDLNRILVQNRAAALPFF
jgi:hypothetical protein